MILDGKSISKIIINECKEKISKINKKIGFAVIWVGNDEASSIYVRNKLKKCDELGINGVLYHLDENTSEKEIIQLIERLNDDENIDGMLLQSPVPNHININNCFNRIKKEKDIDGFSSESIGSLILQQKCHISCTPRGIMELLKYYNISLEGKNVVIINRSNIVGKPLFQLMVNEDATVTMCHSKTKDLKFFTKNADIIVSAVGKPKFITSDMVKDGAVVIDVGISRVDGHVAGDVDFDNVKEKVSYITPVPGGVGPMTIAMIFKNILDNWEE